MSKNVNFTFFELLLNLLINIMVRTYQFLL